MNVQAICDSLNIKKQCRVYGIGLWQCPRFLFLIMGGVIIVAILLTYSTAQRYVAEPQLAAFIVIVVTAILFVIGHIIVSSFERMAEASRAKSEFVAIMSHQLRTPLSIIKWQLELFEDKKTDIESPEAKNFFIRLGVENQRMIYMINDLLELNRIEDKALYLTPTEFSLKKIFDDIAGRRSKVSEGQKIYIEVKSPENLPDVFADEAKIKSVVSHLLDNAIRYSVNGGKIKIIFEELPKFVRCSISDEGIGISKEDEKRIFSKFFRGDSALRYQTQGLGIRLYLAKAIVEASGGKMGFRSKKDEGSTFWFTLPCAKIKA